MKIGQIKTTPLFLPYKSPFHWARGEIHGAETVLIEIETDNGIRGYGECISAPSAQAMVEILKAATPVLIGQDPWHHRRLTREIYTRLFRAQGICSAPRFAGQVLAGLEMAMWDILGKATGRPVHCLLGGARHDEVQYHAFPMGDTPEAMAAETRRYLERGYETFYIKAGFGLARDVATVRAVREVIGPDRRLRIDPNESWSLLEAHEMIARLLPYQLEFIEQPTQCESISALAQVRASSPTAIAADQLIFTPDDAYDVCRQNAADLIVIGPHESGGIARMFDIATIAAAAGMNICIHGLYESGITACAAHQVAAACPNLDHGNQNMMDFLAWDILAKPVVTPESGRVPLLTGPGLGFELDEDAVKRAALAYRQNLATRGRKHA